MEEEKVLVHLRAANTHQFEKNSRLAVKKSTTCERLFGLVRRSLGLPADGSVFLYFKQFAIFPDTTVGDIMEHVPGLTEIDINYSISPQFG
jgi:hypothetical protein